MEKELQNTQRKPGEIKTKIEKFYEKEKVDVPGVEPEDFTKAIVKEENE